MDTLDNILSDLGLSHIDFIKIDAEGAEVEILKGASHVLSSPNIKLAVAAYHLLPDGRAEFPEVKSYLTQRDFKIHAIDEQFIHAIKRS